MKLLEMDTRHCTRCDCERLNVYMFEIALLPFKYEDPRDTGFVCYCCLSYFCDLCDLEITGVLDAYYDALYLRDTDPGAVIL
jgi:hypothetical protein